MMKKQCKHPLLGAFIENLRKRRQITVEELALEAHISTKTYIHIKKGMMRGSAPTKLCLPTTWRG